ncbi:MAG TPA: response regulator [Geminicoccaceae bacterium]|nr:response regulator [Geminicoccaceae bacterium]
MAVDKSTPILVVDDYRTMVRIVRNLLQQLGFDNVDDASDGASALVKLRERTFGLVISDWMMEPMSGLELLEQIRADPKLRALPFIMITAENRKDRVARAEQAGADGFIVKPFNAEALSDRIAAVMGR